MPEMRTYQVTQTRTLTIRANSAVDAVRIAEASMEQETPLQVKTPPEIEGVWGYPSSPIRVVDVHVKEN